MDKQKEILAAALKLFVLHGFHGTATSKIAKEAGVANGTLFHYYATKDDLILSLYLNVKMQMGAFIEDKILPEDDFQAKFRTQFVQAMYWATDHPDEFQYLQQVYASPYAAMIQSEAIQQQMEKTCMEIQQAIDLKIIKPLPVNYIFMLMSSHIFGLNQYLKNSDFPLEKQKEITAQTFDLLWDMLT